MKLIRFAFISVVVIGGLITAISSLFPSTVITSRAVEVNATQAQIQHCVQDLSAWKGWMSDWKDQSVVIEKGMAKVGTQTIQMVSVSDSASRPVRSKVLL